MKGSRIRLLHTAKVCWMEEYYFLQGDPADRIYLLEAGRIKLSQGGEDGSQVLLRVIEAPHLFGAVGMTSRRDLPGLCPGSRGRQRPVLE